MNQNNELNNEASTPKDAFEFQLDRAFQRALRSPVISDSQTFDAGDFAFFYETPPYRLGIGLLVIFLDAEKYGLEEGSFYPFWVLATGYVSKKEPPTQVKLNLLAKRFQDTAIDLCHRYLERFENAAANNYVIMNRDAFNYEWRVPFSENEIRQLETVFQDIIRRKK